MRLNSKQKPCAHRPASSSAYHPSRVLPHIRSLLIALWRHARSSAHADAFCLLHLLPKLLLSIPSCPPQRHAPAISAPLTRLAPDQEQQLLTDASLLSDAQQLRTPRMPPEELEAIQTQLHKATDLIDTAFVRNGVRILEPPPPSSRTHRR